MKSYRSLLRYSATYAVPIILAKMGGFFLLPVYTRYLNPSDYGVLELLDLTSFVLSSLLGARLGDALCYFYAEATTRESREKILTTAFLSAMAMGAAGALGGYLLTAPLGMLVFKTTAYGGLIRLVCANLVLLLPNEVGLTYLRVRNQSKLFAACLSLRLIVMIIFNVYLLVFRSMGVAAMLWGSLASSAVSGAVVAGVVFWGVRPSFSLNLCRRMAAYALPVGIGGVAMLVIHYGDRFFLLRYATLADVGIYSLAYKLGMLVSYVQQPFMTYWTSQMYRTVKGADGEAINARVCTYLVLALSGVAVAITVFSRPVLGLMTAPAFRGAAALVPIIAAAYLIRGLGDQFRNVFLIENRTISDAQTSLFGSVLCLAGYFILIPLYKAWGAAAATLVAFAGMAAYSYWKSQSIRRYRYETKRLWKIGLCAFAASAVALIAMPAGLGAQFAVAAGGLLLFVLLLAATGVFTREEIATFEEFRGFLRDKGAKAAGRLPLVSGR